MKTKTYSYRGRIYSEIPKEIADILTIKSGDEIEFKPVYENLVLIAPSRGEAKQEAKEQKQEQGQELEKKKIELLKKVNSIKYYDRTYDNVANLLNSEEKKLFDEMFKEGMLFRYKRAGKELLGIDKKYFKFVIEGKNSLTEKLVKEGYIVLDDQNQAKELNDILRQEKLNVRGIRGFDKRYYIVSVEKLDEIEKKLDKILTKEKILKTISSELGLPEDLCKAAIEILRDDGKIIEKRKNTYVLA